MLGEHENSRPAARKKKHRHLWWARYNAVNLQGIPYFYKRVVGSILNSVTLQRSG